MAPLQKGSSPCQRVAPWPKGVLGRPAHHRTSVSPRAVGCSFELRSSLRMAAEKFPEEEASVETKVVPSDRELS